MKGIDIGHISVKVPKILELRSSYSDANQAMSYLSDPLLRSRVKVSRVLCIGKWTMSA